MSERNYGERTQGTDILRAGSVLRRTAPWDSFWRRIFLPDSLKTVSPEQIVVIFKPKWIFEDNIVTSRPDRTELIMFYSSSRYICVKVRPSIQ